LRERKEMTASAVYVPSYCPKSETVDRIASTLEFTADCRRMDRDEAVLAASLSRNGDGQDEENIVLQRRRIRKNVRREIYNVLQK